jgi:hypothetical protein
MDWQEIFGNWVLVPQRPVGVVHFLGGAFIAAAPHITYRRLLEYLAQKGFVIVATPFINTFDHSTIAEEVLWSFNKALDLLEKRSMIAPRLPIYGVGHSMGCKLHLLVGSLFEDVERSGNVLISFNNFAAKESIPLFAQFAQLATTPAIQTEFTPSPQATKRLVAQHYQVQRNLLIKFANDSLDQSLPLADLLENRFPGGITTQRLRGNHLTPLGQNLNTRSMGFAPINMIGDFVQQEVFRELGQLEEVLGRWFGQGLVGRGD